AISPPVASLAPKQSSSLPNPCPLKRIKRLLTRRTCLPPFVDPHPLFRVNSNILFDDFRESLCVSEYVMLLIARPDQLDRRAELQPIFPCSVVPAKKARHHRRIRAQSNPRQSGCSRRRK